MLSFYTSHNKSKAYLDIVVDIPQMSKVQTPTFYNPCEVFHWQWFHLACAVLKQHLSYGKSDEKHSRHPKRK